jgi:O-antigen ligase
VRPLPEPTSITQPTFAPTSVLQPSVAPPVTPGAPPTAGESTGPATSPASPPSPEPQASTPAQSAEPSLEPLSDTLAFRLERVAIALTEIPDSPFIGFGAESFGQRHPERYAGSGRDHIAVMAVVVPYEAGIIGAVALAGGFLLLIVQLWRTSQRGTPRENRTRATAAAFLGTLVSMLVAYQSNNALHLAINWIVIGAAVALTIANEPAGGTDEARSGEVKSA